MTDLKKPYVGQVVCTCRMAHVRIIHVDPDDNDTIKTEDGMGHSYVACCDEPDHTWKHPPAPGLENDGWPE